MDEFGLIHRYFQPLCEPFPGALRLNDDAAILSLPPGQELVITKDAISEGVHFIGDENPALIARKLLRVNLSDLAAMGAKPIAYFLACILPRNTSEEWVRIFCEGLAQDQQQFAIYLAGGDTISTNGPLTLSLTALGSVPAGKAIRRSTARAGDAIFVSGTLGDSALGLALVQSQSQAPAHHFLQQRYLLPEPRMALGLRLSGLANAAMDISDGLVQDLGHICSASGLGATINRHQLPLSADAAALIKNDGYLWNAVLNGGDDYELLFTVPPERGADIAALAASLDLPLTQIGSMTAQPSVRIVDETGQPVALQTGGFRHFY